MVKVKTFLMFFWPTLWAFYSNFSKNLIGNNCFGEWPLEILTLKKNPDENMSLNFNKLIQQYICFQKHLKIFTLNMY